MYNRSIITTLISSMLLSTTLHAEINTVDEKITVTATKTSRYLIESPASIAIVNAKDIQRSSADSIASTLKDIPGIQVADAATSGMKRITLRGESSLRVAILIDGQEITDHSTYGAPLLLDTSMVERIEVIRGTSSVLYGGKALGGVVNIITKKGGSEPIQASFSAGFNSATKGKQYAATLFGHVEGFDYRLAVSDNDHDNRYTPKGALDETRFSNNSQMLYLAKEVDDHLIGVNYENYELSSEIATGMPNFSLNMPQRDREKFSVFYQYDSDNNYFKKFNLNAYSQTVDRNFTQNISTSVTQPPMSIEVIVDTNIQEQLDTMGINSQLDFSLSDNHYTILGMQFAEDDLNKATDNSTSKTIIMPNMPATPVLTSNNSVEAATLKTKAVYIQDEWRVSDKLIVTAGARHYWVDANLNETSREGLTPTKNEDTKVIASLAANYALGKESNLRMAFSQGYHYPTLLQVATGATAAGSFINPNPELKAETSDNIELGYRMFTKQWQIDTTVFYTDAAHYITTRDCQENGVYCITPPEDKVFINADTAKTKGIELSTTYHFNEQVSPYLNITWLSREEVYGTFKTEDTGTPAVYGRIGIKYEDEGNIFKSYYLDSFVRASSSAKVAYESGTSENYDSWKTFNVAFGSSFGQQSNYQLNIELSNLFNESYTPATDSLMAPGRSAMIKLTANF
ncbi:TonB-dependent receptor plug domain-containing protein [Colwellia sp. E150_009]